MSDSKALTPVAEADYDVIESAVMETQRGRWFLKEYARRNRAADTTMLLGAIERLEGMMRQSREAQEKDRLRMDLLEMARAISRTRQEISSLRPQGPQPNELGVASEALDGIVRTTERATSDILGAAEHIQEAAWILREEGASEAMCDELDRRATDIYTACSFQDLTAQRTTRIVDTLRFLEGRINAMIEIWGDGVSVESEDEAPARTDSARQRDLSDSLDDFNGLCQDRIDTVIVDNATANPVDAYFFNRGSESEPPRLADEIDDEIDCAGNAEDDVITADASMPVDHAVAAAPVDLESDEDEIAEAELETDIEIAELAAHEDADVAAAEIGVEIADETGPLPTIDALPTREKLRRFS